MSDVTACFSFLLWRLEAQAPVSCSVSAAMGHPAHICLRSSSGAFLYLFLISIFHPPDLFFLNLYAFPVCQMECLEAVLCILRGVN